MPFDTILALSLVGAAAIYLVLRLTGRSTAHSGSTPACQRCGSGEGTAQPGSPSALRRRPKFFRRMT